MLFVGLADNVYGISIHILLQGIFLTFVKYSKIYALILSRSSGEKDPK